MLKIRKISILLASAAIALAGCSGSTNSETGSTSVAIDVPAATGPEVSRDTYSFNLPAQWEELPLDGAPEDMEIIAGDVTSEAEFMDNMNVSVVTGTPPNLKDLEDQAAPELEGGGATDVQVNDRVTIDNHDAAHISANMAAIGGYSIEQFYLTTDDGAYLLTFSFGADASPSDRVELSKSVLATWNFK